MVYELTTVKNIASLGDISSSFTKFLELIRSYIKPNEKAYYSSKKNRKGRILDNCRLDSFKDTLIICNGSCGLGLKKQEYMLNELSKLNDEMVPHNLHILFVRGNNDNPLYYTTAKIDFSNIKTLEDYSVVKACNEVILCVGGGVSINKKWKIKNEERYGKKTYWEDEAPYYDGDLFNKISKEHKLTGLITFSHPSFIPPYPSESLSSEWVEGDEVLTESIRAERNAMDSIYMNVSSNKHNLNFWQFSSDFHFNSEINGILFRAIHPFRINVIRQIKTPQDLDIDALTNFLSIKSAPSINFADFELGELYADGEETIYEEPVIEEAYHNNRFDAQGIDF